MNKQDKPVVDMRWLAEGREDDFSDYLERSREDLSCSDMSDDELANYAFMYYDRDPRVESQSMILSHQGQSQGLDDFVPRIAFMTAVKERLRWLSRRVAVLEGRYPGVPSPVNNLLEELNKICKERSLILEIYYEHEKGGWCAPGWGVQGHYELNDLVSRLIKEINNTDQEHVIEADQPPVAKESIIPKPMPELSIINAEGEHVVNPEWENWYEDTYGTETGSGYLAGKAIMRQVSINNGRAYAGALNRIHGSGDTHSFVNEPGLAILRSNLEVGVETMEGVQRILEDGYAEGIAELKALGGTQDPKSFLEKASDQYLEDFANRQIERLAKELYDTWSASEDWVPWTERGNSDMQMLAREVVTKRLKRNGERLLVGGGVQKLLQQVKQNPPRTPEESQWYKELDSFFTEVAPGYADLDAVIDKLITQTTVSWEEFCKGFSYNEQTGELLSISYELKLENLFKFREEFRAGKFNHKPGGL